MVCGAPRAIFVDVAILKVNYNVCTLETADNLSGGGVAIHVHAKSCTVRYPSFVQCNQSVVDQMEIKV